MVVLEPHSDRCPSSHSILSTFHSFWTEPGTRLLMNGDASLSSTLIQERHFVRNSCVASETTMRSYNGANSHKLLAAGMICPLSTLRLKQMSLHLFWVPLYTRT